MESWKNKHRIVNTYIDVSIPVLEVTSADVLFVCDALKWDIVSGITVHDDWVV